MIWFCIVCLMLCLSSFIILLTYRAQIKKMNQQLKFIRTHQTNLLLTNEIYSLEINVLIQEINDLIEEKRKLKVKQQAKEEEMKEIYTNLSHDIRTPLTSLDGYIQLLSESSNKEDQTKYVKIIEERIKSLKEILDELFLYSKLKNDNFKFEYDYINFTKIIWDTLFSFYEELKKLSIEPVVQITEEEIYVYGNETAFRRILQNIIKNSLVHGKKDFIIRLERKEKQLFLEISNELCEEFSIDIDQIFQRFYKADMARNQSSTGLGLAIAKEMVERMNGEIKAEIVDNYFIIRIAFPIN